MPPEPIRLATWNVNSVKIRIVLLLDWLRAARPDIVMLQEIKCLAEDFPRLEIEDLGYHVAAVGQKTYNGVALLSRHPMTVEHTALPGDAADAHARYLEAVVEPPANGAGKRPVLRVASIYLPNGNPVDSDKYPYKLAWMKRLRQHAKALLAQESVRPTTTSMIRWAGATTRSAGPRRGANIGRWSISASPMPCGLSTRSRTITASGTTRPAAGSATRGCASTTCCCRRRLPTG